MSTASETETLNSSQRKDGQSLTTRKGTGTQTGTTTTTAKSAGASTQTSSGNTTAKSAGASTQTSSGNTTAKSAGTSTGETKQAGENNRSQTAETVRNLVSESRRAGTTVEKANIGFQITFTIPIKGRIPANRTNC